MYFYRLAVNKSCSLSYLLHCDFTKCKNTAYNSFLYFCRADWWVFFG